MNGRCLSHTYRTTAFLFCCLVGCLVLNVAGVANSTEDANNTLLNSELEIVPIFYLDYHTPTPFKNSGPDRNPVDGRRRLPSRQHPDGMPISKMQIVSLDMNDNDGVVFIVDWKFGVALLGTRSGDLATPIAYQIGVQSQFASRPIFETSDEYKNCYLTSGDIHRCVGLPAIMNNGDVYFVVCTRDSKVFQLLIDDGNGSSPRVVADIAKPQRAMKSGSSIVIGTDDGIYDVQGDTIEPIVTSGYPAPIEEAGDYRFARIVLREVLSGKDGRPTVIFEADVHGIGAAAYSRSWWTGSSNGFSHAVFHRDKRHIVDHLMSREGQLYTLANDCLYEGAAIDPTRIVLEDSRGELANLNGFCSEIYMIDDDHYYAKVRSRLYRSQAGVLTEIPCEDCGSAATSLLIRDWGILETRGQSRCYRTFDGGKYLVDWTAKQPLPYRGKVSKDYIVKLHHGYLEVDSHFFDKPIGVNERGDSVMFVDFHSILGVTDFGRAIYLVRNPIQL